MSVWRSQRNDKEATRTKREVGGSPRANVGAQKHTGFLRTSDEQLEMEIRNFRWNKNHDTLRDQLSQKKCKTHRVKTPRRG